MRKEREREREGGYKREDWEERNLERHPVHIEEIIQDRGNAHRRRRFRDEARRFRDEARRYGKREEDTAATKRLLTDPAGITRARGRAPSSSGDHKPPFQKNVVEPHGGASVLTRDSTFFFTVKTL